MTGSYSPRLPIREDLAAAHARAWELIARPGTWWDGAARVAICGFRRSGLSLVGRVLSFTFMAARRRLLDRREEGQSFV